MMKKSYEKKKKYKILHNRSECIGCGACVEIAPETWKIDSDGLAKSKKNRISEKELEKNISAAKSCPKHIISIVDEKGKKII